jgi:anti-sigma regulatory factor (Ser/Thr protein kinase)
MNGPAPVRLTDALDWLHEEGKRRSEVVPELDVEETLLKVRTASHSRAPVLELNPSSSACKLARDYVRRSIQGWNADESGQVTDDAVLLTAELVTNALTHGEIPVTVAISWTGSQLRVEVHDHSGQLPILKDPDDDKAGRGLLIVTSLATEWGFYRTPTGKVVFFILECR